MDSANVFTVLKDLVSAKSLSSREELAIEYISQWCNSYYIPYKNVDGNILVTFGTSNKKHLVLNAHMDVVSAQNWNNSIDPHNDPFTSITAGGKMYGRGTADTKSGLSAMLLVIAMLQDDPNLMQSLDGKVTFLFSRGEESEDEWNGVKKVLESKKIDKPTAVIIAEPSNLEVLIGTGGLLDFNLTSKDIFDEVSSVMDSGIEERMSGCISSLRKSWSAIDRCVLGLYIQQIFTTKKERAKPILLKSSDPGYSFRSSKVRGRLGSGEVASRFNQLCDSFNEITHEFSFECSDPRLVGHPAYAEYGLDSIKELLGIFLSKYVATSGLTSDAINLLIFRCKQKVKPAGSDIERMYYPLPNIELTSLNLLNGKFTLNVSCRTSPEVHNDIVSEFLKMMTSEVKIVSSELRKAVYTSFQEEIVQIAGEVAQNFNPNDYPYSIQRGASDSQIFRSIYPEVPFILFSSGSGVRTSEGTPSLAPSYLSTSHQPNEFVDKSQLSALPMLYYQIILKYLKRK